MDWSHIIFYEAGRQQGCEEGKAQSYRYDNGPSFTHAWDLNLLGTAGLFAGCIVGPVCGWNLSSGFHVLWAVPVSIITGACVCGALGHVVQREAGKLIDKFVDSKPKNISPKAEIITKNLEQGPAQETAIVPSQSRKREALTGCGWTVAGMFVAKNCISFASEALTHKDPLGPLPLALISPLAGFALAGMVIAAKDRSGKFKDFSKIHATKFAAYTAASALLVFGGVRAYKGVMSSYYYATVESDARKGVAMRDNLAATELEIFKAQSAVVSKDLQQKITFQQTFCREVIRVRPEGGVDVAPVVGVQRDLVYGEPTKALWDFAVMAPWTPSQTDFYDAAKNAASKINGQKGADLRARLERDEKAILAVAKECEREGKSFIKMRGDLPISAPGVK